MAVRRCAAAAEGTARPGARPRGRRRRAVPDAAPGRCLTCAVCSVALCGMWAFSALGLVYQKVWCRAVEARNAVRTKRV